MSDQVYGPDRRRRLLDLLRSLAARIAELESDADLLAAGPELLKLMGDARTELFHYEVRSTYDSPEVAESRRVVDEARRQLEALNFETEDDAPWRDAED